MNFRGSYVAIVTPFSNGVENVNLDLLAKLVNVHCVSGTAGIVPCGTTGESPTLTDAEHAEVIRISVEASDGRLPVIAGTGSNSTKKAVKATEQAAKLGASAVLVVTPYYNKPSANGLVNHFKEIDSVGLPIILYNVPGRTGSNVDPDTTVRIWNECVNVVALKAANGNLDEITEIAYRCSDSARSFSILSGDDSLTLPIISVGGSGVISVAANIAPKAMSSLVFASLDTSSAGSFTKAKSLMYKIHPFGRALLKFGSNPESIKSLMNRKGVSVGPCRSPLCFISDEQCLKLESLFDVLGEPAFSL